MFLQLEFQITQLLISSLLIMSRLLQPTPFVRRRNPYEPKSRITLSWTTLPTKESSYTAAYRHPKKSFAPSSLPFCRHHVVLPVEALRQKIREYQQRWPLYAIPYQLPVCPGFVLNAKAHELPETVVIKEPTVCYRKPTISTFKDDYGPESVGEAGPPKFAVPSRRQPITFYEEY